MAKSVSGIIGIESASIGSEWWAGNTNRSFAAQSWVLRNVPSSASRKTMRWRTSPPEESPVSR